MPTRVEDDAGRCVRRVRLNGGAARIRDHAVVPKGHMQEEAAA
jgi:hypothetical protein